MTWSASLRLRGAGGEPVDLRRTVRSHGLTDLPPLARHGDDLGFDAVVALPRGRPVRVTVREDGPQQARVTSAVALGAAPGDAALAAVRHLLRLDDDLSGFYALVAADEHLAWAAAGAGRLLRSQTVFEDVVKTICTTNCAWSATVRMVTALVHHLGEPARGEPATTTWRAFPTPAAMAAAGEDFYAGVARAGYRGASLRELAERVAAGDLDLEALGRAGRDELSDDELEARLLELRGVGPYAAAHVMLLLGRHSRLVLDSWTRPTWARVDGRRAKDPAIVRRFARYGDHAGLAFWLRLTQDWVPASPPAACDG
jgi:N-glycosylase/DNA lyase